jgi:hypothetical protein
MGEKPDVWQGTLALMALRTLETMGPLHGYGLARRIEQTSGDQLQLNYGTPHGRRPVPIPTNKDPFVKATASRDCCSPHPEGRGVDP